MNRKGTMTLAKRKAGIDFRVSLVFILPALFFMALYIFYPIVESVLISLTKWNGLTADKEFIGLANWKALIVDEKFWRAFLNNIVVMVLSLAVQMPFAVLLATILSIIGRKGKAFKILWFLPNLMSSVAVGFLFKYAFRLRTVFFLPFPWRWDMDAWIFWEIRTGAAYGYFSNMLAIHSFLYGLLYGSLFGHIRRAL